ncbi:MAG: response regulator transcription factor [Chloroflexi bacterium]|nr:response regulator transcription factor [Chloroflexota bacterium]
MIEDDKNLALAFAEALEEADYQVDVFFEGQSAKDSLEQRIPAIIILDLHIPNIKGTEILKYIRSDERLSNIRVIVATADNTLAKDLNSIADLVLLKPVGFKQLKDLAARLKPQ